MKAFIFSLMRVSWHTVFPRIQDPLPIVDPGGLLFEYKTPLEAFASNSRPSSNSRPWVHYSNTKPLPPTTSKYTTGSFYIKNGREYENISDLFTFSNVEIVLSMPSAY